jgi:hypothetical protein
VHCKRLPAHGPQELFTWSATVASVQATRCAHERASALCVLLPARACPRLGAARARHGAPRARHDQTTHDRAVGSVEAEEAAAYLASHEGEERLMRPRQPRRPAAPLLDAELSREGRAHEAHQHAIGMPSACKRAREAHRCLPSRHTSGTRPVIRGLDARGAGLPRTCARGGQRSRSSAPPADAKKQACGTSYG